LILRGCFDPDDFYFNRRLKEMENIKLLNGMFKNSQEKGKEYLLYLDVDRLAAPCYEAISQPPKKSRYGGWESTGISGHSIGHWLLAAAQMYAITKEEELKQKVDYAVNELAHIQSYDQDGYIEVASLEPVLTRLSLVILRLNIFLSLVNGCHGIVFTKFLQVLLIFTH
jgi:hypothetical protein